jgi:hypothetical protein
MRALVERSHRAFDHSALDATLNGLMMQSERPADRKKRRIFPIDGVTGRTPPSGKLTVNGRPSE